MDIQELLNALKSIREGNTDEWKDLGNLLATNDSLNSLKDTVDQYFHIAIGVAAAALLLALIALIVSIVKANNLKRQVNLLLDAKQKAERQQGFLDDEIRALQKNIDELKKKTQALGEKQISIDEAESKQKEIDVAQEISQPVKHEPTDEELYRNFVADYNILRNDTAGGMAARNKRMQFLEHYHVQGIVCTNYTKRMTNPDIPPAFQAADPKNAHYWAMPLREGRFAVVPTMKDYEEQYHSTAGAKEVFKSNFQSGSCHKITVKKPAIFMGLDTCSVPGELILQK